MIQRIFRVLMIISIALLPVTPVLATLAPSIFVTQDGAQQAGLATPVHSTYRTAIEFTATETFFLTDVWVLAKRAGNPGTQYGYIYSANQSTGSPTGGTLLATDDACDFSTNSLGGWKDFNYGDTGTLLTASTIYDFVLASPGGDGSNRIDLFYIDATNPYANSSSWQSSNSGTTWAETPDADYFIILWGYSANTTPQVSTLTPTAAGSSTVRFNGELLYDGGSTVTAFYQYKLQGGVSWTSTANTTITNGDDFPSYTATVDSARWYTVRAVGVNENGYGYGEELPFKLSSLPSATAGPGASVTPPPVVTDIDNWLEGSGFGGEAGHWIFLLFGMAALGVGFHKSKILMIVLPLLLLGLAIVIGWVSGWVVLLLALGAGIWLFDTIRGRRTSNEG